MPVTSASPERVTIRTMVISFLVSVPVLSEQMTDVDPSVSTDDSFFTIARWAAMRCTPSASTTDRIAGSPSGTAATAIDTPSSNTSTRSRADSEVRGEQHRRHHHRGDGDHRQPQQAPEPRDLPLQRRRLLHRARRAAPAICPISVCMPVAVTTARPTPWLTAVPL